MGGSKYRNGKTPEERRAFWYNEQGLRRCCSCEEHKGVEDFHNDKRSFDGKCTQCKACACSNGRKHHARRMKEDPAYKSAKRESYVKSRWGLSEGEYNLAWQSQKVCGICEVELLGGHQTHLDHDHETGAIRKFLCTNCNRALGHFQDSKEIIMKALTYLEEHGKEGRRP